MSFEQTDGHLGEAFIVPREPIQGKDGTPYIPLYYSFPFGYGNSINPDSALVKPFRKLMDGGELIGKIAFVFYRENSSYYVLGSFAFAQRIVFFPGVKFSRIIHTLDGKDLSQPEIHNLEHFTLENNLTRWHVKALEDNQQKIKYPTQCTKRLNNNTFLWFVMGIPSVSKLESMPMTQEYKLKAPHKVDLERRLKEMRKSLEGNNFPILDESKDKPTGSYFINFEFFISNEKRNELNLPSGIFIIPPPSSKLENFQGNVWTRDVNDFSPNDSISISIRTSKINGSLVHDTLFYSGGVYT